MRAIMFRAIRHHRRQSRNGSSNAPHYRYCSPPREMWVLSNRRTIIAYS